MTVVRVIRRLRDEFTSMPGLRLTEEQVQRLCGVGASTSVSALRALVSAGFLSQLDDGSFRRADIAFGAGPPLGDALPWRHIVCLVDFEHGSHDELTGASHSALAYATALGIAHRANVTALHLAHDPSAGAIERAPTIEGRAGVTRRPRRVQVPSGPIDVHVATAASTAAAVDAVRQIGADLIVLARPEPGTYLARLRDVLRDVPCHVLVIHPSGQAAVA